MNIKTESIKDILESFFNKTIDLITEQDLLKIKSLNIERIDFDGSLLEINYDDLKWFTNLIELRINNCMVNYKLLNNIKKLTNINKISFINCDFIDEPSDFFNNLNLKSLILDNCIGLSNISIKNIQLLIIRNMNFDFALYNIEKLEIFNSDIIGSNNLDICTLVINVDFYEKNKDFFQKQLYSIEIKNNRNEIVKVINND